MPPMVKPEIAALYPYDQLDAWLASSPVRGYPPVGDDGSGTATYLEVRGPGFMWNIDHKNSIAFTTRLRAASQFSNINRHHTSAVVKSYVEGKLEGQAWLLRLHHQDTGIPYGIALAIGAIVVYPGTPWIKMVDLSRFVAG